MNLHKLTPETNQTLDHAQFDEQITMGIDQASQSFIIDRLVDLYEDPLLSAIREVISNAIDASVKAQSEHAIEITHPTLKNPFFKVRDFGTGMNRDQLTKLYAQFGASNKREDLDQIGAYGLGAKSPLAYTNSLIIHTVQDGVEEQAVAVRSKDGLSLNLLEAKSTDKCNQTTISFAVEAKDFPKVKDALMPFVKTKASHHDFSLTFLPEPLTVNQPLAYLTEIDYQGIPLKVYTDYHQAWHSPWRCRNRFEPLSNTTLRINSMFHSDDFHFILQGAIYKNPLNNDPMSYILDRPQLYLELVPGLMDFTSSRDQLAKTACNKKQIKALHHILSKEVPMNYTKVGEDVLDYLLTSRCTLTVRRAILKERPTKRYLEAEKLAPHVYYRVAYDGSGQSIAFFLTEGKTRCYSQIRLKEIQQVLQKTTTINPSPDLLYTNLQKDDQLVVNSQDPAFYPKNRPLFASGNYLITDLTSEAAAKLTDRSQINAEKLKQAAKVKQTRSKAKPIDPEAILLKGMHLNDYDLYGNPLSQEPRFKNEFTLEDIEENDHPLVFIPYDVPHNPLYQHRVYAWQKQFKEENPTLKGKGFYLLQCPTIKEGNYLSEVLKDRIYKLKITGRYSDGTNKNNTTPAQENRFSQLDAPLLESSYDASQTSLFSQIPTFDHLYPDLPSIREKVTQTILYPESYTDLHTLKEWLYYCHGISDVFELLNIPEDIKQLLEEYDVKAYYNRNFSLPLHLVIELLEAQKERR